MIRSFPCCVLRKSSVNEADLLWIYRLICYTDSSTGFSSLSSRTGHRYTLRHSALASQSGKQICISWRTSSNGSLQPRLITSTVGPQTHPTKTKSFPQSLPTLRGIRFFSTRANHYEILAIKQNATQKDIRSAFIKQSKRYHPDLNRGDPNNHAKFVRVNEAFSVLSKPVSRRDYDLTLASGRTFPRPDTEVRHSYGPQFYAHSDKPQGGHHHQNPHNHHGVGGIARQYHSSIVLCCFVFMLLGGLLELGFVISTYDDKFRVDYRPRHGYTRHTPAPDDNLVKSFHDHYGGPGSSPDTHLIKTFRDDNGPRIP